MNASDPRMKRKIDQILEQEYRKVKALLAEYSGAMHDLAQIFMENDEADGQDVEDLVAKYDGLIAEGKAPRVLPKTLPVAVGADREPEPYVFGGDGSEHGDGSSGGEEGHDALPEQDGDGQAEA